MPITNNEEETIEFAKNFASKTEPQSVICLFGNLGTGKTTFTKGFVEHFGKEKKFIKSPTFTYMRIYKTPKGKIYHLDLYRINETDYLFLEEFQEILDLQDGILIIEWADKISPHLPKNRIEINFEYKGENQRKITRNY